MLDILTTGDVVDQAMVVNMAGGDTGVTGDVVVRCSVVVIGLLERLTI
jgi:hypothetical protein